MIGRRTLAALLLATASCVQFDQAIGLRPHLERVEILLRQGEYAQASRQFDGDRQMKAAIKWIRALDRDHAAVYRFDMTQIDKIKANSYSLTINSHHTIYLTNTLVTDRPEILPPFSQEFVEYLENRIAETRTGYNAIVDAYNENLEVRAERRRREAEERAERRRALELQRLREAEELAERHRAREARQVAERKAQKEREAEEERLTAKVREDEVVRLNQVAQAAGFAGYEDTNILSMIAKTQREGGLEDYLGKVIGCHRLSKEDQDGRNYCERRYRSMKILQVGEEMLLYRLHTNYAFLVQKEAGKLYQEGQRFKAGFHVFVRMHTYQTVAGASRTVPVFKKVEL